MYPTMKSIMCQQRGKVRATRVIFSEFTSQLIVKYFFESCWWIIAQNFLSWSVAMHVMPKNGE